MDSKNRFGIIHDNMRTIYTPHVYKIIQKTSRSSAKEIVPLVVELIKPKKVVDLGCGTGDWLAVFKEHGINDVLGIDGDWVDKKLLQISEREFMPYDLKTPLKLENQFDLAMSLEVVEHIPIEYLEIFMDSLTRLAPVILFSATIPHQFAGAFGVKEVNEQWQAYWAEQFKKRGYVTIDCIRKKIWENNKVIFYYAQNILIFAKKDYLKNNPLLKKEYENNIQNPLSIVHPILYLTKSIELKEPSDMSLKELLRSLMKLLKALPLVLVKALKRRLWPVKKHHGDGL